MNKSIFFERFMREYGFDPALKKQAICSAELTPEYPVLLVKTDRQWGVALYDELELAIPHIEALAEAPSIDTIMRLLFEDAIEWRTETVNVYLVEKKDWSDSLPPGYSMGLIRNMKELEELASSLTQKERFEALPWETDKFLLGIYFQQTLVAACGATQYDGYLDVVFCVHPAHRHKGLGVAMISRLCKNTGNAMLSYRTRADNSSGIAIANKLEFIPVCTYYGAQLKNFEE